MSNKNNQNKLNFFVINDTYTACGIIEGFVEIPQGVDPSETMRQAWQYLIDTGVAWKFNPPYEPQIGGVYEIMIWAAK